MQSVNSREQAPARLLHVFPSFGQGGVPLRMCEMMNRLGPRFRHTVVALDGVDDARRGLRASTRVDFLSLRFEKRRSLATLLAFAGALRRLRPDLLLTYNWGAVEWALVDRLLRVCPHLHFESGFGPEEADGQIRRRVLLRRIALARAAAVVVPSRTLLKLATDVWRLDPARLHFLPNGVDLARFGAPPVPDAIPGFAKRVGELIVGTVAPLRREKNIHRLVRAFAALPAAIAARLVIVGDGPERPGLVAAAAELGLSERVVFAGHVDAPEKALGWFDVFAISSDTEQMPNALLQAMAAGRAVAGVDVGDVREIVAPANRRFVVPRADEAGFAASIAALLADGGLRAELGAANRAHVVATYDIELMAGRYRTLFEEALGAERFRARPLGHDETLAAPSDLALPR
jgi:glycosyltransferase involved in cell wall biosynthesis